MSQQLTEAFVLLGVGMTVVFIFLSMLIIGIKVIAAFVRRFPGPDTQAKCIRKTPKVTSTTSAVPDDVVAAIGAAIHTHRRSKTNK